MAKGWCFLSKNGQDKYINWLAHSAGYQPCNTDFFDYQHQIVHEQHTLVLRGILKYKIMQSCWQDQRSFWYMDSGYIGNTIGDRNPQAHKIYHRIVPNDLQHRDMVTRPADRWQALGIHCGPRKWGNRILLAAPDEKPCRFYGIDRDQWLDQTIQKLKAVTQRPIVVRERAARRQDRALTDPLASVLQKDVHALVTFNSNAAVEAVIEGVPVFVLAPTHAAAVVGNRDLDQIDDPFWPDDDLRHQWLCHLAYCQFSVTELKNGRAFEMINETQSS